MFGNDFWKKIGSANSSQGLSYGVRWYVSANRATAVIVGGQSLRLLQIHTTESGLFPRTKDAMLIKSLDCLKFILLL